MMGAMAMVEAADSLAKNRPSGLEKEAMKVVKGAAEDEVRLRLQKASFQHRMMHRRPVEAMPGKASGISKCQISSRGFAPSMRPASRMSCGTSLKKVKSSQTAIGRVISV